MKGLLLAVYKFIMNGYISWIGVELLTSAVNRGVRR